MSDQLTSATSASTGSTHSGEAENRDDAAQIPAAIISEASTSTSALVVASKMWWVTLLCLALAVWLTWISMPASGPTVRILFPEGHGLKTGDFVRHRGIEVGQVQDVSLSEDLSQITATVVLTPGAEGLAREGTRFWIVRPQLSLTGISGLETAVGAKYIGVSPGDPSGLRRTRFNGLSFAPPDEDTGDGVDVILRGDATHGVTSGAPVTWRGLDVGRILSVSLSPDARFVDVHARIRSEYKRLVRSTSRFWVTSGLGLDVGLSGIKLNADSLSTIVRGGVSFTTLATSETPETIVSGHMFTLFKEADAEWLENNALLPLVDFALPETITIQARKHFSTLGVKRSRNMVFNGVLIQGDVGQIQLLTTSELTNVLVTSAEQSTTDNEKDAAQNAAWTVQLQTDDGLLPIRLMTDADTLNQPEAVDSGKVAPEALSAVARFDIQDDDAAGGLQLPGPVIASSRLRSPGEPEDCCICRQVKTNGKASSIVQSLGREQLESRDGVWVVTTDNGDMSAWNGSPVVALTDGRIIGVFCFEPTGPQVAVLK